MEKLNELTKNQKNEEKLLKARIIEKIKKSETQNSFLNSDFLDLNQQSLVNEIVREQRSENSFLYGGYADSERKMFVAFPSEIREERSKENFYKQIMKIIRVTLPKDMYGCYEHRNYLSALMKLGIKREKVGDILVREGGADIIIATEIEKFLILNLNSLTRFKKAKIESKSIDELIHIKQEKQQFRINIPSMRLDCIVGELARCSRSEALEIIKQERVLVDFKEELSQGRQIKENTYITIRGKGRFKVLTIEGITKSGRLNVLIEK